VGYLIVFAIASAVGVAVYAVTLREEAQPLPGLTDLQSQTPAGTYVSVAGGKPDWQSRLTGLLGLFVAVIVGAAALAAVLYISFQSVFRLLGSLAPHGGASSGGA